MISHEVLKWKLEMYIVVNNTQYLFWVGEGEETNMPHIFPHHPEMPQAIKVKLYDFKNTS